MPALGFLGRLRAFLTSRRFVITLTALVGLLAVLYLVFVSFFFNPFEDDLEDTASIVPREVDYFLRWKDAGSHFDSFPLPAAWGDLEDTKLWTEMQASGASDLWDQRVGISQLLADLGESSALTPAGLSMKTDFLREVAIAGMGSPSFGDSFGREFNGMLMLRVSFKVKAGIALLNFGFVRNKLPESLGIESMGDQVYRLPGFGPFGFRDAYLARIQDVLILATGEEWLDRARDLQVRAGEDSLAFASQFRDAVEAFLAQEDQPLEAYVRWESVREAMPQWPPRDGDPAYFQRALGIFFDTDMMRDLAGYWLAGNKFRVRLSGRVDSTQARTEFMRDWIESSPISKKRLREFAGAAPADSFFFGAVAGRADRVLPQLEGQLDTELKRLLDEVVTESGQYNGMIHLLESLGSLVQPGLYLALRRNHFPDFPVETGENKIGHDDTPVPAIVLMARFSSSGGYDKVEKFLREELKHLLGDAVREWDVPLVGGVRGRSFSSMAIPGTGEVVVFPLPQLDGVAITNSWAFAEKVHHASITTEASGDSIRRKLSRQPGFRTSLDALDGGASMFLYFDPSQSWPFLEELSQEVALATFHDQMEATYAQQRPALERRLREELFGSVSGVLSSQQTRQLSDAVDEELAATTRDEESRQVPGLAQEYLNGLLPLRWLDWVSIGLKASRRNASAVLSGELDLD